MSDGRDGVLLKIVRRQPMIVGTDEGLEECPGPARGLSQEEQLVGREPRAAASQRPAYPPGDRRRGGPQQKNGKGGRAARRASIIAVPIAAATATAGAIHMLPKGRVEIRATIARYRLIGFSIDFA